MEKRGVALLIAVFMLGFVSNQLYGYYTDYTIRTPFSMVAKEQDSPSDIISDSDIMIKEDYIMINLLNARVSSLEDTNSMDPILDEATNTIEVPPSSEDDFSVGDIISFYEPSIDRIVIHRVIEVDMDEHGWYALTKGDNNKDIDDWKVRFSQVQGKLVGILY